MRVLIVEDEPGVRSFLCRAVEYLLPGSAVEAQANGLLALEAFLAEPADLVISDHHMPQMSGMELLQALRARSMAPFIMISAESSVEPHARIAGASAFVSKPATLEDLRRAICRALASAIGYTEPCAK